MADYTFNRTNDRVTSSPGKGNKQNFAYNASTNTEQSTNWGSSASRSLYSTFANFQDTEISTRELLSSRLWHGVPQLTMEQMAMFEAAYTGHTFLFVVDAPKFMTTGIYANKNLHYQMRNLKAVIERASTSFSGVSNMQAEFGTQNDGNGKKLDFVTAVYKDQTDITLRLREFAGLPVKNALESWVTGTFDPKSQHGNYFGNLGIPGGWCLANHTMALLVVQVDPSWQVIQDAAFYYNMFPVDVPFDHFEWTKGEQGIVDDLSIQFKCNEERSPMIMYAAERYMNNRILSMVSTSVYNSRQFVVSDFMNGSEPLDYTGFKDNLGTEVSSSNADPVSYYKDNVITDRVQYNQQITQVGSDSIKVGSKSAIETAEDAAKEAKISGSVSGVTHEYYKKDGYKVDYKAGTSNFSYNAYEGANDNA